MAGVRIVATPHPPKFFAADQFKLEWGHFTKSELQPEVKGKPVHAKVSMTCEIDFMDGGDVLIYQDQHKRWLLGHLVVKSVMNKAMSTAWSVALRKNTLQQNAELLKHERVHVELYERHARHIFQQVQKLSVAGGNAVTACDQLMQAADRIRDDHWKKAVFMNERYDIETDHGRILPAQSRWNSLYLSIKNTNATL